MSIKPIVLIEHLWNPGLGIGHLCDTLRPNGTLLLSTPNPSALGINYLLVAHKLKQAA